MAWNDLLWISGTGEPDAGPSGRPEGMLRWVSDEVDRLAPGMFRHHTVPYWKQYAAPHSHGDSRAEAERVAFEMLDRLGGAGGVGGYSMGAGAAGNIANRRDDVAFGYLLADPLRPKGANSTGMPGQRGYTEQEKFVGFGINGQRAVGQARWYTLPDDVIADAYPDSLVRDFADLSEFLGFADLDDARQWMVDVTTKILTGAWQNKPFWERMTQSPLALLEVPGVVQRTVRQGLRYPGWHCSYNSQPFLNHGRTYVQEMARDIVADAKARR